MTQEKNQFTKKQVIEQIQAYLADELSDLLKESESSGKALPARAAEIQQQLVMYRFMPIREYGAEDVICPGGLVQLELNQIRAFYFIVPNGGGLITHIENKPVQVITPNSPLGEALLGHKLGDEIRVRMGKGERTYKIVGYA